MTHRNLGFFFGRFDTAVVEFIDTQLKRLATVSSGPEERKTAANAFARAIVTRLAQFWIQGNGQDEVLFKLLKQELKVHRSVAQVEKSRMVNTKTVGQA